MSASKVRVDELAERGRARRQQQQAQRAQERAEERAIEARRMQREVAQALLFEGPLLFAYLALAAAPVGLFFWLKDTEHHAVAVLSLVAGCPAVVLASLLTLARVAVRLESAWLDRLPFEVEGYFRVLVEHRDLALRIDFEADVEKPELLKDVGGTLVRRVVPRSAASFDFICTDPSSVDIYSRSSPSARQVRFVRSLFAEVLLPLHGACAIEKVTFNRV